MIKNDPELLSIPVVVLTTSAAPADVETAYRGHANCYIATPLSFVDFAHAIDSISTFWLDMAATPPAPGKGPS